MARAENKEGSVQRAAIFLLFSRAKFWPVNFFRVEEQDLFLWSPVLLAVGIGIYFALPFEPPLITGTISLLLVLSFLVVHGFSAPKKRIYLSVFLMVSGFFSAQLRTAYVAAPILEKTIGPVRLAGDIEQIEDLESYKGVRIILGNLDIENLPPEKTPKRIRLSLRKGMENLRVGQKISVLAKINAPSGPLIPDGFDFRRHLFYLGIGGVGFIYNAPDVIEPHQNFDVQSLRVKIASRVAHILPPEQSSFVSALLVGKRGAIKEDDNESLRAAGLAHILAISGLHVGLLAGAVFFMARFFMALFPAFALYHPIKKYAAVLGMMAALFYMILAGATPPTQRAVIMAGIVFFAILIDRSAISLRLLAVSAFVILLVSPENLVSVSFQMSFAAVAVLVFFYNSARGLISKLTIGGGSYRKLALYFMGLCLTSVLAGAATAPFSIYHFQTYANYGVLANLVAIPLMGFWVMPMALLIFILMPVGLDEWPLIFMGYGVEVILQTAHFVSALPYAQLDIGEWPFFAFLLLVCAGIWFILWQGPARNIAFILVLLSAYLTAIHVQPDILVAQSGDLFLYRADNDRFIVNSRKTDRFALENWMSFYGATHTKPSVLAQDEEVMCDADACRFIIKNTRISYVKNLYALREECYQSDLVTTSLYIDGKLPKVCNDKVVLSKSMTYHNGAVSVYLDTAIGHPIQIKTTRKQIGKRPWAIHYK